MPASPWSAQRQQRRRTVEQPTANGDTRRMTDQTGAPVPPAPMDQDLEDAEGILPGPNPGTGDPAVTEQEGVLAPHGPFDRMVQGEGSVWIGHFGAEKTYLQGADSGARVVGEEALEADTERRQIDAETAALEAEGDSPAARDAAAAAAQADK